MRTCWIEPQTALVGCWLVTAAGCSSVLGLDDFGPPADTSSATTISAGPGGAGTSSSTGGEGGEGGGDPPLSIALISPEQEAVGPPTRRLLTWFSEDGRAADLYLAHANGSLDEPYRTDLPAPMDGVAGFVVQASTDGRVAARPDPGVTPIHLSAGSTYRWKVCITGSTVCTEERIFATDASVAGWWRFDEAPNEAPCGFNQVCDASGNERHGLVNGAGWTFVTDPGFLGGALAFPSEADTTIELDGGADLNPANLTVQARVSLDSSGEPQTVVDRRGAGSRGFHLEVANGATNPVFGVTNHVDEGDSVDWLGMLDPGNVHLLVGRWAVSARDPCAGTLSLFVDGSLGPNVKQLLSLCREIQATAPNPVMGENLFAMGTGGLRGTVDELILYDRALTDEEIREAQDAIDNL